MSGSRTATENVSMLAASRIAEQRASWFGGGMKNMSGLVVAFVVLFFVLPAILSSSDLYFATGVVVFVSLTSWSSFLMGFAGIPAFGNQIFYGGGAYITGFLIAKQLHRNLFLSLAASLCLGAVMAAVIGGVLRGRVGLTFGMLTLAIGQAAYIFVNQTKYLYGTDGISGIVPGNIFGQSLILPTVMYRTTLCVCAVSAGVLLLVRHSIFGTVLNAVRQDRDRATALGVSINRYRTCAFVIAGAFCAVAGSLQAIYVEAADPSVFYWTLGATPILAGLLGGIRSFWGPLIGAVIYQYLQHYLSGATAGWELWLAAIVLGLFLIAPYGLLGLAGRGVAAVKFRRLRSTAKTGVIS